MATIRRFELGGDLGDAIYAFSDNGLWLASCFAPCEFPQIDRWVRLALEKADDLDSVVLRRLNQLDRVVCKVCDSIDCDIFDIGWFAVDRQLCRRFFTAVGEDKFLWTVSEHKGHAAIVRCKVDNLIAW